MFGVPFVEDAAVGDFRERARLQIEAEDAAGAELPDGSGSLSAKKLRERVWITTYRPSAEIAAKSVRSSPCSSLT